MGGGGGGGTMGVSQYMVERILGSSEVLVVVLAIRGHGRRASVSSFGDPRWHNLI